MPSIRVAIMSAATTRDSWASGSQALTAQDSVRCCQRCIKFSKYISCYRIGFFTSSVLRDLDYQAPYFKSIKARDISLIDARQSLHSRGVMPIFLEGSSISMCSNFVCGYLGSIQLKFLQSSTGPVLLNLKLKSDPRSPSEYRVG